MLTEKQMTALLDIKDGVDGLDEVMRILSGRSEVPALNEGVFGKLANIYELILELSPLYEPQTGPDDDITESPAEIIMDDREMSNKEKAKKLLGL